MFKKFFSFSNVALFVALCLSTVAAWYSIIGLTAIFAGAVIPIIIMGSVLEVAKVTTTVWLRKYWKQCSWILKLYLVPAVMALALMTSMGIFGFLSKAHMDQGVPTGDIQAKVSLIDEKIKTQKENIQSDRDTLAQMDAQVNNVMNKGDSERSAERSVLIRKQQAPERARLMKDIETANIAIAKLNEERAPIASTLRKAEAEVGPIKYIAAFIYGDNPDQNVLERAVRWVIILLVVVFDPLAILLVIGANQSKEWDKELEKEVGEKPTVEEKAEYESDDGPLTKEYVEALREAALAPSGNVITKSSLVEESDSELDPCYKCGTPLIDVPGIGPFCPNKECDVADSTSGKTIEIEIPTTYSIKNDSYSAINLKTAYNLSALTVNPIDQPNIDEEEAFNNIPTSLTIYDAMADTIDIVTEPTADSALVDTSHDITVDSIIEIPAGPDYESIRMPGGEWVQTGPTFTKKITTDIKTDEVTKELYRMVGDDYVEYEGKRMHQRVLKSMRPDLFAIEDDDSISRKTNTSFGTTFPEFAHLGDTFVRVDNIPNRVFKFNGAKWIESNTSDAHLSNPEYLQHLIEKIASGEYDPDLLTENEQDAISNHIKDPN